MDYCLELSYDMFIANEMLEQAKLERFVNESLLIMEGTNTVSNMTVIVESFGDKFKEIIKKIVNAVVNMWHKFLEGMNTLFKSDKAYLEKYKDIILKKQVNLGTLTMPNYEKGMNELLNKKIPPFNYQGLKSNLSNDKEQGSFRKSIYNDYNPSVEFPAFVKNKMQGGEKDITVKGSQLNMTNLFNFCYNFDKLAKGIENEINTINKVGNQAIAIIDERVRKMPKQESMIFDTIKYFSNVYEAFIDEAELGTIARKKLKDSDFGLPKSRKFPLIDEKHISSAIAYFRKASASERDELAKNIIKRVKELGMKDIKVDRNNPFREYAEGGNAFIIMTEAVGGLNDKIDTKKTDGDSYNPSHTDGEHETGDNTTDALEGESAEEATENIKTYINVCGQFLAAKLTIARNCHKDYMSIIREHVRSYEGNKEAMEDKTNSKQKDADTNTQNPSNEKKSVLSKILSWK